MTLVLGFVCTQQEKVWRKQHRQLNFHACFTKSAAWDDHLSSDWHEHFPITALCLCVSLQFSGICLRLQYPAYIPRFGQSRIYSPYMTIYLVISLPNKPYVHRIYMVLANPIHTPNLNYPFWGRVPHNLITHTMFFESARPFLSMHRHVCMS